jgi:hypothetical protein
MDDATVSRFCMETGAADAAARNYLAGANGNYLVRRELGSSFDPRAMQVAKQNYQRSLAQKRAAGGGGGGGGSKRLVCRLC